MTAEEIRKLYRATPFVPFTICLEDGRSFQVLQREFLAISPTGRSVIVSTPDDSFEFIDFKSVCKLEMHGPNVT